MRILLPMILAVIAANATWAQETPHKQGAPKLPCHFDDSFGWDHLVIRTPPIEELMRFDDSFMTEHRVFFPTGTLVSVSRQEGPWSCVTGPFGGPSSGSQFLRTGWMKTELLVRLEPHTRH